MHLGKKNAPIVDINIKIGLCSYDAAKYAVERWHYSKCLPLGRRVCFGIWENQEFKGVIIFSRGASPMLGKKEGFEIDEVCELTRIALNNHNCYVSHYVKSAIKKLKQMNNKLKLIFSFADQNQNHLGKIYQAGNWIYAGETTKSKLYFFKGKWRHPRDAVSNISKECLPKYKYMMPLDKKTRKQILKFSKPYPKEICSVGVMRSTDSILESRGGADPSQSFKISKNNKGTTNASA